MLFIYVRQEVEFVLEHKIFITTLVFITRLSTPYSTLRVGIIEKRKPALISRLFFMPLSLPWPHLCVEDFQYPHLVGSGTFYY